MKQLQKLKLKNVSELSNEQMQQIAGGVSREEYCRLLAEAFKNNADSWDIGSWEGFAYGWNTYCKS